MHRLAWSVLFISCVASGYVSGDDRTAMLDDETSVVELARVAEVFMPARREETSFSDIAERGSRGFVPTRGAAFSIPWSVGTIWLRFSLNTESAAATYVTWWHLRTSGSPASIEVFFPHIDGSYRTISGSAPGDRDSLWRLRRRESCAIPVYPDTRESVYYLRIVPGVSRTVACVLESPQGFHLHTRLRSTVEGSLLGIAVFMIIYSLILYHYTKDRRRLWFTGMVTALLLTELSVSGIWEDLSSPDTSPLFLVPVSIVLVLIFFSRYAVKCVMHGAPPSESKVGLAVPSLFVAGVVVPLVLGSIGVASIVLMVGLLVVSIAILVVASYRTFRRDPQSRLFLLSWAPALVVISAVSIQSLGVLLPWYIDTDVVFVAMTIGIVLTSMTTGHQYSVTEGARRKAVEDQARLEQSNAKLQSFAASARAMAAEDERDRIAREIHDTVGYALTTILAQVGAVTHIYGRTRDEVSRRLQRIDTMIRVAMRDVRNSVHQLREQGTRRDVVTRIRELCRAFTHATGARVGLSAGDRLGGVSGDAAEALFHTVQEGLTNAWRHGNAHRIRVRLHPVAGASIAVVTIRDFGDGAVQLTEGTGLTGIRERIEAVGGTFKNRSSPGCGCLLCASVPIEEGHDDA